jgi:filamentous hemagglutinin family protein
MSLKNSLLLFSLLCTFTPSSFAEITLDGSLGRSGALIGPNYAITADLGKQIGGNLFHSFRDFNLDQNERATFSGPNSINNVISRVTGGNPSHINGRLSSTIPNADVYFLNPAGILFGESAKLNVQGGFHASTADTLRLGSDGEFNASDIEKSVLTVAAPSAFGFLAAKPAAIILQDSKLSVPIGKTLSLIGGDLQLNGIHTDETFSTKLSVESGRLNLASLASPGEVIPTQFGLDINPQTPGGTITTNGTQMEVKEGGQIFIRGGQLNLIDSQIKSETTDDKEGGAIDIRVDQLGLQNIATISTETSGSRNGGNIFVKVADILTIEGISEIYASSKESATGNAGNIEIQANQITLTQGGQIVNETKGTGKSGDIIIKVGDSLTISGSILMEDYFYSSGIYNQSSNENAGTSGDIQIKARQVTLKDGVVIRNVTLGTQRSGSIVLVVSGLLTIQSSFVGTPGVEISGTGGRSGDIKIAAGQIILTDGGEVSSSTSGSQESGFITIKVDGDLTISSSNEINAQEFIPSGIFSESTSEEADAGNAGNITIEADQIILTSEAEISSSIQGHSKAGNIEIKARQIKLNEAKILSKTEGQGEAGTIIITTADTLNLSGSSEISTDSAPVFDRPNEMSDAGEIEIMAQSVSLDDSTITSETTGKGGTIILDVKDALNITQSGKITTQSRQTGDAGKIDIAARQIKLTQGGEINSTTYGSGKGGSIKLNVSDTLTVSGRKSTFISSRIFGGSNRSEQMGEAGDAGTISIEANKINLIESGEISTSTNNASGGNINIIVPDSLYLQAGAITTNVRNDQGNGGEIKIAKPDLVVLNKSRILTNADQGWGGKITIAADKFIRSVDSLLDASSKVEGRSGGIKIEADSYVGEDLIALPKNFLNPLSLQRCETRFAAKETRSRFIRANRAKMRRDELKEGVWGSHLDSQK